MKKFIGVAVAVVLLVLLVMAIATPVMAGRTTVQVWWLEDAERFGGDGDLLQEWTDCRIPLEFPETIGYIEFTRTGKAYHADMEWFYNYYPLENFRASPMLISPGKFAAWARYTSTISGLPILDKIRGKLTIVILDDTEIIEQGTAEGDYVQYSYVEGITDEETVMSWYPHAVATDDPDVWLVGITYYIVHGQTP